MPTRLFVLLLCLWMPADVFAQGYTFPQNSKAKADDGKTLFQVELLLPDRPAAGSLIAQKWGQRFDDMGIPCRIRKPILVDKVEIEERPMGRLRQIRIVGQITRQGTLRLPGNRSFDLTDRASLAEWFEELKLYGVQGSPDGEPLWGLNQTQFSELFDSLKPVVETSTQGLEFSQAIEALKLPGAHPLKFPVAVREQLNQSQLPTCQRNYAGLSKGVAFALMLNEWGLGFQPRRLPSSTVELMIVSLEDSTADTVWPVGWSLDSAKLSRTAVAPKFYQLAAIEYSQTPFPEMLADVGKKAEVAVFTNEYLLKHKGVELDQLVVNSPLRQTIWPVFLKAITGPSRLTFELRVDEAGHPIVYLEPLIPKTRKR